MKSINIKLIFNKTLITQLVSFATAGIFQLATISFCSSQLNDKSFIGVDINNNIWMTTSDFTTFTIQTNMSSKWLQTTFKVPENKLKLNEPYDSFYRNNYSPGLLQLPNKFLLTWGNVNNNPEFFDPIRLGSIV